LFVEESSAGLVEGLILDHLFSVLFDLAFQVLVLVLLPTHFVLKFQIQV
jgi:hypothetical protein